jgi:hypothetical protein
MSSFHQKHKITALVGAFSHLGYCTQKELPSIENMNSAVDGAAKFCTFAQLSNTTERGH